MGAHSTVGHGPERTVTAAAGLAAALVTTAATGFLTGGTALATDGSDGSDGHGGSGHSHGHRSHGYDGYGGRDSGDHDVAQASDAAGGLTAQTWCDLFGDTDLGDDHSCAPDDGSAAAAPSGSATTVAATSGASAANPSPAAAPAPKPAPMPRPTSSVPDHPTVQPIVAPASGRKVVPIAAAS